MKCHSPVHMNDIVADLYTPRTTFAPYTEGIYFKSTRVAMVFAS